MDPATNLARSTVAVAPVPADSGTTMSFAAAQGDYFPDTADGSFVVVAWPPTAPYPTWANCEMVRVTARTVDAVGAMTRAQGGTTAKEIAVGWNVVAPLTAEMYAAIVAILDGLGNSATLDVGSTAGTVCAGDDSRLSDGRDPNAHATSHQNGGADEISVSGLSGVLADAQHPIIGSGADEAVAGNDSRLTNTRDPNAHAASHKSAGGDSIKLDELAAPTDVTTLNVSTSAHGLTPKLPNDATKFLDGTGAYTVPPGSGSGISQLTGDVTAGPGSGSQSATIPAGTVTYAKMQDVSATDRLLGRSTAGAGDVEEITCTAAGRTIIAGADAAAQRASLGLGTIAVLDEPWSAKQGSTQDLVNTTSPGIHIDQLIPGGTLVTAGKVLVIEAAGDFLNNSGSSRVMKVTTYLSTAAVMIHEDSIAGVTVSAVRRPWWMQARLFTQSATAHYYTFSFGLGNVAATTAGLGDMATASFLPPGLYSSSGILSVDFSVDQTFQFGFTHITNHASLSIRTHAWFMEARPLS